MDLGEAAVFPYLPAPVKPPEAAYRPRCSGRGAVGRSGSVDRPGLGPMDRPGGVDRPGREAPMDRPGGGDRPGREAPMNRPGGGDRPSRGAEDRMAGT